MKQIKDLETLKKFIRDYEELKKINKRLHKYFEINCEYGLTNKQIKNQEKLENKAKEIAKKWDLYLDLCTDPRGIPICLTENKNQFRYSGLVIPL